METYADLIGCEDVLLFADAAITSTGQREFHSAAGEQRLSLAFLHSYIHGNYPDLYAATLALDVNDHNLRRGQVPLGGEAGRAARAPVAAGRGRLHRGGGARARRRPQGVRDLPGAVRAAAVRGRHAGRRVRGAAPGGLPGAAGLRAEAERHEREWAGFHDSVMAAGLLRAPAKVERVYRMGRYTLSRFLPSFERKSENHIGETITDEDGRLAYLKTFRLPEAQCRRGHLLSELAAHGWSLAATAATLRISVPLLAARLERAGFGHLLRQDVMDAFRKQLNERTRRTRRGGAASPPT
jgi:hypothetical protein